MTQKFVNPWFELWKVWRHSATRSCTATPLRLQYYGRQMREHCEWLSPRARSRLQYCGRQMREHCEWLSPCAHSLKHPSERACMWKREICDISCHLLFCFNHGMSSRFTNLCHSTFCFELQYFLLWISYTFCVLKINMHHNTVKSSQEMIFTYFTS